jgi:hypothetical protein
VIPHDFDRGGNVLKEPVTIVSDHGCLSVHQAIGSNHATAKGLADGLMAQTDTKNRDHTGGGPDQWN